MKKPWLVATLILATLTQEARAYEMSIGLGRMSSCLARTIDGEAVCSFGPGVAYSLGLNVWGDRYKVQDHEKSYGDSMVVADSADVGIRFLAHADRWEDVVVIIAVALFMASLGYALLYPFSSRLDIGLLGRSGWQQQDANDLELWRNEAGVYIRAYLSQHFPLYLYASGLYSYQNLTIEGAEGQRDVFVKSAGLGLMAPQGGGLYFHGLWERSTLLDPSARDLLKDSTDAKILKTSLAEVIDGTYFEAGYLWRF